MSLRRVREGKSKALTNPHEPLVKPSTSKTAKYAELPRWMQDNEYILAGYRWYVLHNNFFLLPLGVLLACSIGRNTRSGVVSFLLSRVSEAMARSS